MEKGQPFVKQEYGQNLAQSVDCCKTPEEINLVRKIESRTKNLLQGLNSIKASTNGLNKNLLPQAPKMESEAGTDKGPPQGWLECHLADLDCALRRCGQIYDEVTRLVRATKTDKVGQ